ncbi:MAG TPA: NAD(P)/FAD-dependent oxidoreductase [Deltaproteobacteria bacterium]|nr:NAD(P)/FAD-dependent oxidoreductase [Deltaproteobacteria bacterium]
MGSTFFSDAIVIGAGPAGLGTALGLAREGVDVIVLDKQDRIGSVRRGETVRFDKEMDDILGGGFFEKQSIRKICKRTYFSHTGTSHVDRVIRNPNNIISWPDFIQGLADVVSASGARIWPASNVVDLIERDGGIRGVRATVSGHMEEELTCRAVFSCGGFDDPASRMLGIDRSKIDLPVTKQLVKGYKALDDRLEYHFHVGEGVLAVCAVFPRGNEEAEIILMSLPKDGKPARLSFERFSEEHPLFRKRIRGSESVYTLNTMIPMGGMIFPVCRKPGLVMAGDALGHVQARGGSGIRTSFLIGYAAGRLGAQAIRAGEWTGETVSIYERHIRKSPHVRSLRLHNFVYSTLRSKIFGRIGSPEEMDGHWHILQHALR